MDVRTFYKKLLALYPRAFKEQLEESMEQTFNDLYRERQTKGGWFGFMLFIFTWGGLILEEIYCLQGIRCD